MRRVVLGSVVTALACVALWLAWQRSAPSSPRGAAAGAAAGGVAEADTGDAAGRSDAPAAAEAGGARTAVEPVDDGALVYELLVIDPDRQPVVDAEVRAMERPQLVVRSDRHGRCRLPVHPGAEHYLLRVSSGARHVQRQLLPPRAGVERISLPWSGPLRGHVVDVRSGAPLAGIDVTLQHDACQQCEPERTTSDADGRFELSSVPRGVETTFVFRGEHYALQWDRRQFRGDGAPLDCTFPLRAGHVVRGRVVDLETHQPVVGATVSSLREVLTRSATDGSFAVRLLPDVGGTTHAEIRGEGYCRHLWRWQRSEVGDCVMVRALQVRGVVRATSGEPIAGAAIDPSRQTRGGRDVVPENCQVGPDDWDLRTRTDERGEFVLDGVVPGDDYRLRATHGDFEEQRERVQALVARDAPVAEIRLQRRPAGRGTAVLRGVMRLNGEICEGRVGFEVGGRKDEAWSDTRRGFRIEHLPAGRVELTALPDRFRRVSGRLAERISLQLTVELGEGQERELDLDVFLDMTTVAGHVRHPDGTPAVRTHLFAGRPDFYFDASTGEDGSYSIELPQLLRKVVVRCSGRAQPGQQEVLSGATDVDFVVPLDGELRFRTVGPDGPVLGVQILLREIGGPARETVRGRQPPDELGYCTARLPRGDYEAMLCADGYAPLRRTLTIGEHTELDAELAVGHTVTLRLASDAPPPPRALDVELVEEGFAGFERPTMRFFGSNRVVQLRQDARDVRHVTDGRHTLKLRNDGFAIAPDTIEVAGADVVVELRWKKVEESTKPEGR
ncbi:MAG: carboxypeptidase regulatory-like domain-containing protein [Planctomycetes bacterium]|nr:carboxypeptidase regulatory-like domain-containing protein [Planctomycetota bacterium]